MIDNTITSLYDHIYKILYKTVSPNVYIMNIPTDLTKSDKEEGFIVIIDERINDNSEFPCEAFGDARVNIIAFIPPMKRGRANMKLYKTFENKIKKAIEDNAHNNGSGYSIDLSSLLEYSDFYNTNGLTFNMLVKSYKIIINNKN